MADDKAKDHGEKATELPEAQPLQSSDAEAVILPTVQEKQMAEADRTNQSTGSIAELAMKSRGMSREQVAQQLAAQGDSVSIDYGNGLEASRKTGLTDKDIQLKAQEATEDQRPIIAKSVEIEPQIIKTGLDYNVDNRPLSEKLVRFAESAQARLLDPAGREAYFQGLIDRTIGIGEGLNEAKEEIKAGVSGAALMAWKGLTDGSVARFLAQPNAINEPLFKTVGNCLDVMSKDPNAVNNVLTIMGRELLAANDKYSQMTPRERGIQDGKAMFYFINPSGSMEAADMAMIAGERVLEPVDKALLEVVRKSMETASELAKTSTQAANQTKEMLFDWLKSKGFSGNRLSAVGIPDEYFADIHSIPKTELPENVSAMVEHGHDSENVYRGDHDIYSRFNTKGRPKSYINEEGDLSPANPEGLYKGKKVTVEEHLAARWCRGAKAHSPYTSFGEKGGVMKTFGQGNGLALRIEGLRKAIASGEVTNVRIYEHSEVLNSIEESRFHALIKKKLSTWAKAHHEVVVEGIIPGKFLEIGLK